MKKINEMTKEEILGLSNDDITDLVLLACAEDGIKVEPAPIMPPLAPLPPKTIRIWVVKGTNLNFSDEKAAVAVAALVLKYADTKIDLTYHSKYDCKYPGTYRNDELGKIETDLVYTKGDALEAETIEKANDVIEREYKAAYETWKEQHLGYEARRLEIVQKYEDVVSAYNLCLKNLERFQEYLRIAENNPVMAFNFLKKAYIINAESESFIEWEINQQGKSIYPVKVTDNVSTSTNQEANQVLQAE